MTAAIYRRDGLWHVEQDETTVLSTDDYDKAHTYWWNLLHPQIRRSGRAHPPKSAP